MGAQPQFAQEAQQLFATLLNAQAGDHASAIAALHNLWQRHGITTAALDPLFQFTIANKLDTIAIEASEQWLVTTPNESVLRGKLIGLYRATGRHAQSLPHFEHLLAGDGQKDMGIWQAYLETLHECRQPQKICQLAPQAQQLFPNHPRFYNLEGRARMGIGDYEGARECYTRGIEHCEKVPHFHATRGVIDFSLTRFEKGFNDYEYRHQQSNAVTIPFRAPKWNGEPLNGKSLVIWEEQGIGDIIMWGTLLPWLLKREADITLFGQKRLQPLFARSFPSLRLLEYNKETLVEYQDHFDVQMPLGDLMKHGLPHYKPAQHAAVYQPDETQRNMLRKRYEELAKTRSAKRIIGLSWHTTNQNTQYYRNVSLQQLAPLLALEEVQFVSLQYGDHDISDAETIRPGCLFQDVQVNAIDSPDTLAAQVAAMDEVISIQNSTVHIGGALGVPTTIMLSVASSWRFGIERTDNDWYQSLQIERQQTIFEWQPVIATIVERVKRELA